MNELTNETEDNQSLNEVGERRGLMLQCRNKRTNFEECIRVKGVHQMPPVSFPCIGRLALYDRSCEVAHYSGQAQIQSQVAPPPLRPQTHLAVGGKGETRERPDMEVTGTLSAVES
jgi:hypothetical protein